MVAETETVSRIHALEGWTVDEPVPFLFTLEAECCASFSSVRNGSRRITVCGTAGLVRARMMFFSAAFLGGKVMMLSSPVSLWRAIAIATLCSCNADRVEISSRTSDYPGTELVQTSGVSPSDSPTGPCDAVVGV